MTQLDNKLAKGEGKFAERAEKSVEKFFFKTIEVDLPETQKE